MRIVRVDRKEWSNMGEEAHFAAFGSVAKWSHDKADYALLAVDRKNNPIGFISVNEHSRDTASWRFGGVFEDFRDSIAAFRAFQAALEYSSVYYSQIICTVENTNGRMLRFLNKTGFRICGIRSFSGSILVEHVLRLR